MVTLPAETPVTTPVAGSTVAIAVLLLDHVPPAVELPKVDVLLTQQLLVPVIPDKSVTVTVAVAEQPVAVRYVIVVTPGLTP